jgi:hypothetical protein
MASFLYIYLGLQELRCAVSILHTAAMLCLRSNKTTNPISVDSKLILTNIHRNTELISGILLKPSINVF